MSAPPPFGLLEAPGPAGLARRPARENPPAEAARQGMRRADGQAAEWAVSDGLVPYPDAVAAMEARAASIAAGEAPERIWLLEHPPLYTAGTSARDCDLLAPDRLPVFRAGRGGQFTYHGPGQRVVYVMLDLNRRGTDLRRYVATLEDWVIATLADFGVTGERRAGRVGVWVQQGGLLGADGRPAEAKIAAIGVRVRRWISFHGLSLNVDPDLEHYSGIVPCGVAGAGVTSLADLGLAVSMPEVDAALHAEFERLFGRTVPARPEPPAITPREAPTSRCPPCARR